MLQTNGEFYHYGGEMYSSEGQCILGIGCMPFIFLQVFGRNLVLFGLIASESRLQNREVVWWLFLVWCAVELVRLVYKFHVVLI